MARKADPGPGASARNPPPVAPVLSDLVIALQPSITTPEPDWDSRLAVGWDQVWPVESMEPKGLGQGERELWVSVEM